MGNELKTGTWENHKCNKVRSNYKLNYPNNGGISPDKWHSCWVYGPYYFILPKTRRPTWASNRNKSKITYTPWAASMLDCVSWELENRVFPQVFMHHGPIRSCYLRSHDLHMGFQPSNARASKMVGMPTQFDILPPLEEWHINLEVGSQVYQLLKGFKQLWKATLWPDTTSSSHMGGF